MFRCIFSARRPTPTQNGSEQPFRRHFEPGQHKNLAPARQGSGTRAPQRGVYFISHYDISDGATLGNYIASRYIRRACHHARHRAVGPLQAFRRLDRYARGSQGTSTRNEKSRDAPGQQSSETGNLDAARQAGATWLAYNRRVDIVLEPAGQQSAETYPDGAPDARILWARKEPSLKLMEAAAKTSVSVTEAHSNLVGK